MESNEFNVEVIDNKSAELFAQVAPELNRLHDENLTLLMATLDSDQIPHASYTPFAHVDGAYYIFIADIAAHTQHVKNHPTFNIMIVDDESKTRNIYGRKRVSYQVHATEIERDHPEFDKGIEALTLRAGKTVNVLKEMGDFHLFRLTPTKGTLVTGFGKAFRLDPQNPENIQHLTGNGGKGHVRDADYERMQHRGHGQAHSA